MRRACLLAGGGVALVLAWSGLAFLVSPGPFSAHMIVHVMVMAVAAPLIAMGAAGTAFDPTARWPVLSAPVTLTLVELVVVWGWHTPTLHHAARISAAAFVAEQGSFFGVGLMLWISVFGGRVADSRKNAATGVIAMLLTSMHMTLLGALITLAPRVLYFHSVPIQPAVGPLIDQQIAGMVMLFGGSTGYLLGGLYLLGRLLRRPVDNRADHATLG